MRTLGTVRVGDRVRVRGLRGGREVAARLAVAGFTPGAEAVVVQDFGRGPLLVEIRHRVDVRAAGAWLDRRAGLGLARSLPAALDVLTRGRHDRPDPRGRGEGSLWANGG
jgi:Fe2+ transport system protein FeoA